MFLKAIRRKTEAASHRIPLLGILASFGFLSFYFLNLFLEDKPDFEDLVLRAIASCLSVPLIFFNRWPLYFKRLKPIYWNIALFYTQSFFFTYMVLKNNFSTMSCLNGIIALTLIMLVTDLASAMILFFSGVFCAYFYAILSGQDVIVPQTLGSLIAAYLGLAIYVRLFVFREEQVNLEKLKTLKSFAGNIIHETHVTVVRQITSHLSGVLEKHSNKKKRLSKDDTEYMIEFINDIRFLTNRVDSTLNMTLSNLQENLSELPQEMVCVKNCLFKALKSYSFLEGRESRLKIVPKGDFEFLGNADLVEHIFLNLIHNSLYFINKSGKGNIVIDIKPGAENTVVFKDTSVGVRPDFLPVMFEPFQSDRPYGTGIGLSFCRRAMDAMGGTITCESVLGKHTTFTLTFRG